MGKLKRRLCGQFFGGRDPFAEMDRRLGAETLALGDSVFDMRHHRRNDALSLVCGK